MRLEGIGNLIVLVAGLLGVLSRGNGTYSGYIGIALVYGMRITQMLSWAVRSSTELAINMNSVERVLHYVDMADPEEPRDKKTVTPPPGWPNAGAVHFDKLCMRYRAGLELVLKDLDFKVSGGETVGICGRTGAGKSSLMLALFRMIEPASGCIRIDGVDISTVTLHTLRRCLSLVARTNTSRCVERVLTRCTHRAASSRSSRRTPCSSPARCALTWTQPTRRTRTTTSSGTRSRGRVCHIHPNVPNNSYDRVYL